MKNIIKIKTSDLTDEQKMIYNADIVFGKNISIKGGPGTGKTTILFLIAQKIKNLGFDFRIITLQNNLKNFLKDSFGDLDKYVKNARGTTKPKDYPNMRGVMYDLALYYEIDINNFFGKNNYEKNNILKELLAKIKADEKLKEKYKDTIILIDEAQDLPILYFNILNELFNTIYIFGDDNQKINDWGTNINDIEKILNISVINRRFNTNFRNAKQIYNFAKLTGFKEDELELIKNGTSIKIYVGEYEKINEIKDIISDNIGNNIAIITNYSNQNDYTGINGIQIVNSNIEYIEYENYDNFCLNWKNNKGLEFDIVILLDFDENQFFTKEMYVSITRAKDKVFVLNNEIKNYLELEKYDFIDIIEKNNSQDEITVDDLPF